MIVADRLTKTYGAHKAVDDVSFRCEPGSVTGFLGPNGAGKSTTMRMICGFTAPTHGGSTVNGLPYRDLPNPGREVGVLLDASAQHAGRTGFETLAVSARVLGVDRKRVQGLLDRVGLPPEAAKRRVGNYSLGMRQRLGLAHALLGDPAVLILDEPANGLDPEGIHWMRGLLREFADRGGTVLLSSHLLREVEVVADHLVMIGKGRIVAQGSKSDLLNVAGVRVRATNAASLGGALQSAGLRATASPDGSFSVDADAESVGRVAAAAGLILTELKAADGNGLEEMFLQLTAAHHEEVAA
ncbi:ABC transporter ATP-binding protein [Cryptosporangium sp. NPDC048952]|uniref:ABC transporter ATP-binding protein n=1 Tax=Cryptosporangium sp. NPDC048952 TaxID=3363961 RepID=UPI0037171DEA